MLLLDGLLYVGLAGGQLSVQGNLAVDRANPGAGAPWVDPFDIGKDFSLLFPLQ